MTRKKTFLLLFVTVLVIASYFLTDRTEDDLDEMAREIEDLVQPSSISANMEVLAARPHRAGTVENQAVGERIAAELKLAGANVWTRDYVVSLPQPGEASLSFTAPSVEQIHFYEKQFENDSYSAIADQETPYFAYIADSDVEGEVLYANFGDREDYKTLKDQGISMQGKIALVRTDGICRGMKQAIAEEEQLAALLLYPEPKDQGFKKIPYPEGPSIHPWIAQRGSMLKFFQYPGDPSRNFADHRESTLPTVPALPVTPAAAETILRKLSGHGVENWRGWLKAPYSSGPGPARLRFTYTSQKKQVKIRNIFATLGGIHSDDPALMVSAHYDAWIYGASDPGAGSAVVLETAKTLFELQKKGWKPQRDIIFAFWDAEEYGMIGSTNWVMDHLDEIRSGIGNVVYIDSVRGPVFRASIVPGLRGVLDDVLRRIKDPTSGKSVLEFHRAYDSPGFSDDTIPFSNFGGIPVGQLNYGLHYTMYHSLYDNLSWMKKFGDPGYAYASTLARVVALFSVALTRDPLLPFRFSEFAAHYEKELSRMRVEKSTGNVDSFDSAIQKTRALAQVAKQVESLDFTSMQAEVRHSINVLLQQAVVSFTEPPALTARPFRFRNPVYGPSPMNGCAGIELPLVQLALTDQNNNELTKELKRVSDHFEKATDLLRKAIALTEQADAE